MRSLRTTAATCAWTLRSYQTFRSIVDLSARLKTSDQRARLPRAEEPRRRRPSSSVSHSRSRAIAPPGVGRAGPSVVRSQLLVAASLNLPIRRFQSRSEAPRMPVRPPLALFEPYGDPIAIIEEQEAMQGSVIC